MKTKNTVEQFVTQNILGRLDTVVKYFFQLEDFRQDYYDEYETLFWEPDWDKSLNNLLKRGNFLVVPTHALFTGFESDDWEYRLFKFDNKVKLQADNRKDALLEVFDNHLDRKEVLMDYVEEGDLNNQRLRENIIAPETFQYLSNRNNYIIKDEEGYFYFENLECLAWGDTKEEMQIMAWEDVDNERPMKLRTGYQYWSVSDLAKNLLISHRMEIVTVFDLNIWVKDFSVELLTEDKIIQEIAQKQLTF